MPDMRFAPPNPLRIADRASGLNATSVRSYNERLVLSLLLQNERTTRLEIGEKTGLSAQTVSVLVRSLEHEGLVIMGAAQKGRVGPPTTPVLLNADGAFSVGISVSPENCEIVLVDFVGSVRFNTKLPNPKDNLTNHPKFLETIEQTISRLSPATRERLAGIGLALPSSSNLAKPSDRFSALQNEIENAIGHPVFVQNDVAAAAAGESMFGVAKPYSDYLYCYVGEQLHSRLILNHQIYNSNSALSFDVGEAALRRSLKSGGAELNATEVSEYPWHTHPELFRPWFSEIVANIAQSATMLRQFVDFKTIILNSQLPEDLIQSLCILLNSKITDMECIAGRQVFSPIALGAASLPFSSRFMVEH